MKHLSKHLINLIDDNNSNKWLIAAAFVGIRSYTSISTYVKFMFSISTERTHSLGKLENY